MATTVAAMRGTMGSTNYFILAMKARELVEKAIIPSEMEGWDNLTLEEREQRDINYNRVKKQIAPYLARDKDRFFGAIILTVSPFDEENFEPLNEVATKGLPKLYKTQAQLMGFLTFTGGEQLRPLDGQHRLKALKFAMEGNDEKGKKIDGLTLDPSLANEDITVILIPHDQQKSRKIFTKVNRYAKPTTTGQNLVTDDDDVIAVLSRGIANNQNIIGPELVKYKSNTLNDKEGYFTTLATIAECNENILQATFGERVDRQTLPNQAKMRLYEEAINNTWQHITTNVDLFADMLSDKDETSDAKRCEIRTDFLLGKPVPQVCLVAAFARLVNLEGRNKFTPKEATDQLNKVDWKKEAKLWDRLLMTGTKIITKNAKIATDILCYIAGEPLDDDQTADLLKRYQALYPESEKANVELPDKLPQ